MAYMRLYTCSKCCVNMFSVKKTVFYYIDGPVYYPLSHLYTFCTSLQGTSFSDQLFKDAFAIDDFINHLISAPWLG